MTVIYGGKMAFPIHNTGHGAPFDEGMSLRDYIAIQTMHALITRGYNSDSYGVARDSYLMADVMIEHRESGEQ
jgi:hypothetical protein